MITKNRDSPFILTQNRQSRQSSNFQDMYDVITYLENLEIEQIDTYKENNQYQTFWERNDWEEPITEYDSDTDSGTDSEQNPIENLGMEDYTDPYPLPECPICLNGIQQGTGKRSGSCKHFFHKECIDTWLNTSNTCPKCRTPFDNYSTFFGKKRILSDLKYLQGLKYCV